MLPLALVLSLQAVDTIRLSDAPCAACRITIDHLVTLGDASGNGVLTAPGMVRRDHRGRYLFHRDGFTSEILVFNGRGRFERVLGRRGGGPGEFLRVAALATTDRTILAFDDFARRLTTFDDTLGAVAQHRIPPRVFSVAAFADGRFVRTSIIDRGDSAGAWVHEHDADATERRTRRISSPIVRGRSDLQLRVVSLGHAWSTYWVAHRTSYRFAQCAWAVAECREYRRTAEWFPDPASGPGPALPEDGPRPMLRGVSHDGPNHLWVVISVADARWREGVAGAGGPEFTITDPDRFYDTVIERIDLTTNRVIARLRIDRAIVAFVGTSEVQAYREDADGVARIGIMRLRFLRD